MSDIYERFGRILAYYRNLKGLSTYEVADLAEMSQSTYSAFELGRRRIPLSDIMKLSDVLGFDINEIMETLKTGSAPSDPPSKWFSEFDDEEFSPEEITEISNFIKYVISKRG